MRGATRLSWEGHPGNRKMVTVLSFVKVKRELMATSVRCVS